MSKRSEPWYIHAVLYVIIFILAIVLIQVAIIEPQRVVEQEKYYKSESRARLMNIREAEKLWEEKHGKFTDNIDSLINFVLTDELVAQRIAGVDSITGRSTDPFNKLTVGSFVTDSLLHSPKSFSPYILKVDTTTRLDTVINRRGQIVSVDTTIKIGTRYVVECPDGYGKIGDLYSDALKNTASWE
ncbi:MAG: hypothetical protein KJ571_09435 [Bacteroidetes bacterium]|nr:hypothetical protein [Bacteroidota bacterium]